ncbi:MAG TPA: hypothetical protein VHE83_07490 [Mycobacteriales bacterium]|nr:hypothetical protein [Mycobacteriales bacterium]
MDLLTWMKKQWDRVAAAGLFVLGLLALLLGYIGISGTSYPAEQMPYMISGGVFGLFLLGTAGILYLSADMRDEWRKLDELDETMKALEPAPVTEVVATSATADEEPTGPIAAKAPPRPRPRKAGTRA